MLDATAEKLIDTAFEQYPNKAIASILADHLEELNHPLFVQLREATNQSGFIERTSPRSDYIYFQVDFEIETWNGHRWRHDTTPVQEHSWVWIDTIVGFRNMGNVLYTKGTVLCHAPPYKDRLAKLIDVLKYGPIREKVI